MSPPNIMIQPFSYLSITTIWTVRTSPSTSRHIITGQDKILTRAWLSLNQLSTTAAAHTARQPSAKIVNRMQSSATSSQCHSNIKSHKVKAAPVKTMRWCSTKMTLILCQHSWKEIATPWVRIMETNSNKASKMNKGQWWLIVILMCWIEE